jgi:hypothetical protein
MLGGVAHAGDPFAWMPPRSPALVRGRQVADRFDLLATWEVSVEVDNVFSAGNRRAITGFQRQLAALPGVRRVLGPSGLRGVAVDSAGNVMTHPLYDADFREPDPEAESEAIRQQFARRADAAGWFISGDGATVRFLVDTLEPKRLQAISFGTLEGLRSPSPPRAISFGTLEGSRAPRDGATTAEPFPPHAIHSSLPLSFAPLFPDPRDDALTWAPLVSVAASIAFLWLLGAPAWRSAGTLSLRGMVAVGLAAGVGAFSPFALAALAPVRSLGARAAAVAVGTAALALLLDWAAHRRAGPAGRRPLRAPVFAVVVALLVAGAGFAAVASGRLGRLRLATQQWRAAPLLFVSVRADIDQPVVLRELRRLTEFLRGEPGVATAWSVADLFDAVDQPGDDPSRIPDSPDDVRRLLSQMHADPAVRLELSGDHREALVTIRLDAEAEVAGAAVLDRLARYLDGDLRAALLRVDLREAGPAATWALARGLLANDAAERIQRICALAGRKLGDAERRSIERVARRAALIPIADAPKLHAEVAAELRAFLRLRAPPMRAAERDRVATALAGLDADWSVAAIWAALGNAFAPGHPPAALGALVPALARQLGAVRLRHAGRIYEREMLAGASLPSDGNLADEVRAATREAMGPVVGLPVARATPGAFLLDAVVVGGAANDRELSAAWAPGLRSGAIAGAAGLAIILLLVAGLRGVLWYPFALALPAAALILPALTREPVGALFVGYLAGAAAAGGVLATSLAARHRP